MHDYDEGLGTSPTLQHDYPTFVPDEDYSYSQLVKTKSDRSGFVAFPQKLDLSTLPRGKSKNRKKFSPIKSYHDTALDKQRNYSTNSETIDLRSFRKQFDDIAADVLNNSLGNQRKSSASSVSSGFSSTTSLAQRSLSVQISRAKQLVDRIGVGSDVRRSVEDVFADSDFHITTDDETRPPSSQASLTFELEQPRRRQLTEQASRVSNDVISHQHPHHHEQTAGGQKNAATSTSGFLSDSFLADFYAKRGGVDDDGEKTIVDEVFEPAETPILRSARDSSSSGCVERVRNASSQNAPISSVEKNRQKDGLHHSLSVLTLNPHKMGQLDENAHLNRSLPNLERFVIRPSTREIFNTPLDIDAICGKGVRKDKKSSERNFGGTEIAKSIHGESSSTTSRKPRNSASRPTTASTAKRREASRTRSSARQPPYCSATLTDGVSYSLGTVSQQLLGTVKSLHPDWLPMVRRLLAAEGDDDVAEKFAEELRKQQLAMELKFSRNQRITSEEYDDQRTKLCVLFRIREKLDELRSRGGHYSRVQQIKLVHSALLTA